MKYCTIITETAEGFTTEVKPVSSNHRSGAILTMFGYRQWIVYKTEELALAKAEKERQDYNERMAKKLNGGVRT